MLKDISWKKLVQKFRRLGFSGPYSGGRHLFMIKGDLKVRIPNPHRGDISNISSQKFCARLVFQKKNGIKLDNEAARNIKGATTV